MPLPEGLRNAAFAFALKGKHSLDKLERVTAQWIYSSLRPQIEAKLLKVEETEHAKGWNAALKEVLEMLK